MLLAFDVGNTDTKLGLYRLGAEKPELVAHWRLATHQSQAFDANGVRFVDFFLQSGLAPSEVSDIVIASVVPAANATLRQICESDFNVTPFFVGPGIETGMPLLVDNPAELGADRLADSIAAFEHYGGPCVVVNLGTATKFEVISERGEYLGGAIAPGLGISADALFSRAALLTRVDIERPTKVIGTNTITHLQSGLYYGYIGLVDGMVERIFAELGHRTRVIATGGLARAIAGDSSYITEIDEMLTLDGLYILFDRNRTAHRLNQAL